MGATRKLQAEIDRTLKRVTEGLEVFEDIWEKVREEGEWGGWTTETAAARAPPPSLLPLPPHLRRRHAVLDKGQVPRIRLQVGGRVGRVGREEGRRLVERVLDRHARAEPQAHARVLGRDGRRREDLVGEAKVDVDRLRGGGGC